jgi:hypothetical protein
MKYLHLSYINQIKHCPIRGFSLNLEKIHVTRTRNLHSTHRRSLARIVESNVFIQASIFEPFRIILTTWSSDELQYDFVPLCKYSRVHWLWKQSICKEINIDNNFDFCMARLNFQAGYASDVLNHVAWSNWADEESDRCDWAAYQCLKCI